MTNTIHDMRLEHQRAVTELERQLAAKDARIAALEAALRDARREAMHIIGTYPVRKIIEEALDNTHAAKSE